MNELASGDSIDTSKMPLHNTPKTHNTKRRSVPAPSPSPSTSSLSIVIYSADLGAGDFDESFIVNEMKKLCNEDNDLQAKIKSSECSVEIYQKMISSDSYWSSKLRAQRRMAKRRTPLSHTQSSRVRRSLMDDPSFSQ